MSMKIITTVGTSLITNALDNNCSIKNEYDNLKLKSYEQGESDRHLQRHKGELKKKLCGYIKTKEKVKTLSAEIESIVAITKEEKSSCDIHLIATDTILSPIACEFIKQALKNNKTTWKINDVFFDEKDIIKGLQVQDATKFEQEGFMNLISRIDEIVTQPKETILNITGGYKALIPFLTLYGQVREIKLKYLYKEDVGNSKKSDSQLIEVVSLPFNFDWQKAEIYHYYLHTDILKKLPAGNPILEKLDGLKLVNKQTRKRTALGDLLFEYIDTMPDSGGIFGYIFEQKMFEYYVREMNVIPKMNVIYYIKNDNRSTILKEVPEHERGNNLYTKVEIDLLYEKEENGWIIIECKSYEKIKEKLKTSIENSIYVVKQKVGIPVKFKLIVHKYDFQKIERKKQVFQKLKDGCSLPLEIFTVDVPIDLENADINYMRFMQESDIELTPVTF